MERGTLAFFEEAEKEERGAPTYLRDCVCVQMKVMNGVSVRLTMKCASVPVLGFYVVIHVHHMLYVCVFLQFSFLCVCLSETGERREQGEREEEFLPAK